MRGFKYNAGDYLGKNKNILMLERVDSKTGIFECPVCHKPFNASISDINRLNNKVCKECGTSNFKHFPGEYLGINNDILFVKRLGKDDHGLYTGLFLCPVCNELFEARVSSVANDKHYQSCGCNKGNIIHDKLFNKPRFDLTGQRFGNLVVMGVDEERKTNKFKYICMCDCGNTVSVEPCKLKNGHTTSCGCIKSKGEKRIIEILNNLNINYKTQKKFDTCKDDKLLSFDFYLPDYNLLIEYNGIQHYRTGNGWNNDKKLMKTILHDKIKQEWTLNNNIPLLVISYKEFELLNEDYLMSRINEKIKHNEI